MNYPTNNKPRTLNWLLNESFQIVKGIAVLSFSRAEEKAVGMMEVFDIDPENYYMAKELAITVKDLGIELAEEVVEETLGSLGIDIFNS